MPPQGSDIHVPYALTYPQLVLQAVRKGYDDAALSRLRRAYLASQRLFDGLYRAQDTPFLCHVTRTAGIAMEHGGSAETVLVSLLHAAYTHGIFHDGKAGGVTDSHRREIVDAVGAEAERLIAGYSKLGFDDQELLRSRIKDHANLSVDERTILFVALANELEDFLDLQMLFRRAGRQKETAGHDEALAVELAGVLGHAALRRELSEAFQATARGAVPAGGARSDRNGAYELSEHRRMRKGRLSSFFSALASRILSKVPPDNKVRAGLWRSLKRH